MDTDEDFFNLLANPEKISKSEYKEEHTIDTEIIRLLNIKLSEINVNVNIDNSKFEKIIYYIKSFK